MVQLRAALSSNLDKFYSVISNVHNVYKDPFISKETIGTIGFEGYEGRISFHDLVKTFTDLYTKQNGKLVADYSITDLKDCLNYEKNINLSEKIIDRIRDIYRFASGLLEKGAWTHTVQGFVVDSKLTPRAIEIFFQRDDCNRLLDAHGTSRDRHEECIRTWKKNPNKSSNVYKVLGLTSSATDREVKETYMKLALQFHPDKNKKPDASERFRLIQIAYETIIERRKFGSSSVSEAA